MKRRAGLYIRSGDNLDASGGEGPLILAGLSGDGRTRFDASSCAYGTCGYGLGLATGGGRLLLLGCHGANRETELTAANVDRSIWSCAMLQPGEKHMVAVDCRHDLRPTRWLV